MKINNNNIDDNSDIIGESWLCVNYVKYVLYGAMRAISSFIIYNLIIAWSLRKNWWHTLTKMGQSARLTQ